MIQQVLFALVLCIMTVVMHTVGTVYVVLPVSGFWTRSRRNAPRSATLLARLVSALLVLHLLEMMLWAAAFYAAGIFSNFETAVYYSLMSYTTVGYGDVIPADSWRLLGPIEAAVGILMLGISTSMIVATVHRLYNVPGSDEFNPNETTP